MHHSAADMAKAVKRCDYDGWASSKQNYDMYMKTYKLGPTPPAPPYPIPCYPQTANAGQPPVASAPSVMPYVSILGGYAWSQSEFNVMPRFDVDANGAFVELDAGVRFPATTVGPGFWGARAGVIVGSRSGRTFFAPVGADHTVWQNLTAFVEVEAGVYFSMGAQSPPEMVKMGVQSPPMVNNLASFSASAGLAYGEREVTSSPLSGLAVTDTSNSIGFTGTLRLEVPVSPSMKLTGQYRYTLFSDRVDIPGSVKLDTDTHYLGVGITVQFNQPVM